MEQDLLLFEKVMDELRAASEAAAGNAAAQAEIAKQLAQVEQQQDLYVLGALSQKTAALAALNGVLQDAIAKIAQHVKNFPLSSLRELKIKLGGTTPAPDDDDAEPGTPVVNVPVQPSLPSIPSGGPIRIEITAVDLDALQRVAQSEVGHFAKYGPAQLKGGLGAVVDTIINRVAHKNFPKTVEAVVNQPFQFSAINDLQSWTKLQPASAANAAIVAEHVAARCRGEACSVHGATHFLNPYLSSASAMASWGNYVVANPTAVFGNAAKKDVHYHGFAPNYALPAPYVLASAGQEFAFNGDGSPATQPVAGNIRDSLLRICDEEWAYFEQGTRAEDADPQYLRIGKYWSLLGIPYNGRTKVINEKTGNSYNPAWSSAFISYVVRTAGGGARFKYAQAHCHYVQDFLIGRPNALYEVMQPGDYAPRPGDLIHSGREYAIDFGFAEARSAYLSDSFYPSHSDVVLTVDKAAGEIVTVGGNVTNSVARKTLTTDKDGLLKPRKDGARTHPWIAVLRLVG